jgi:hypothetical protein
MDKIDKGEIANMIKQSQNFGAPVYKEDNSE